ncbi:amidohydrolase family protein [Chelatococcus reniformis]|uniref:2-hydroxy-3-carboxy-6-oxo-7-methylocta-2, 4-dienoate decarboxylase n=1 Tax=Chelatococcus reniformis TaxID=1494448 RepID=A0A916XE36_9HYPH|nr:amidohydrolase family protein [Chelatococcus reniformis]GGC65150.1 2-hydroxy-3-carboxy-6-oxo-7-methylocta-2,4-dienoate decarboxylase [Chelatococcus reniformis]
MGRAIDVHTHVVPRLAADAARSRHWPSVEVRDDGVAAVVIAGKVFRIIDSRCWDVPRRLGDLAEEGVEAQVLSPMPELLSHWLEPAEAEDLATIVNTDIARMIAEAPGRFAGLGMVAMQDTVRAIRGLEQVKALGLGGIEIGTHIAGVPLGDASLQPIYEAAQALDLGVLVHPLHPGGLDRIGGPPELAAVAAFPLETALSATSLLTSGTMSRFPALRVMLSHGGGALPWILPRLDRGFALGGAMRKTMPDKPSVLATRFWYDTVLYDGAALRFLADAVGEEQIVVGSDYPFAIRQPEPAAFAEAALGTRPAIAWDNALAFLGRAAGGALAAAVTTATPSQRQQGSYT